MIEINKVTKTFDGNVVLDELSSKVKKGCIYGLIGTNGAGKSTLLNTIDGVYIPDSGEVLIEGENGQNSVWRDQNICLPDPQEKKSVQY